MNNTNGEVCTQSLQLMSCTTEFLPEFHVYKRASSPKEAQIDAMMKFGVSNIHSFFEIPAICHFVWMLQDILCIPPIIPERLEVTSHSNSAFLLRMTLMPDRASA
jgi:hypothetical protein